VALQPAAVGVDCLGDACDSWCYDSGHRKRTLCATL
jgi:hypothetical protein